MTQLTGFNIPSSTMSEKEKHILSIMPIEEWIDTHAIAHASGYTVRQIANNLDRLRIAGYIKSGPRDTRGVMWMRLAKRASVNYGSLSSAEQKVLDLLDDNRSIDEIERVSGLKKHTVHIAIRMLKCRGLIRSRKVGLTVWRKV